MSGIGKRIDAALGDPRNAAATADLLESMAPDPVNKARVVDWLRTCGGWEVRSALRALAKVLKPKTYLEIGVRRGWSLAQVADASPKTTIYGVDPWIGGYGGVPNPGPDFVRDEIARVCPRYAGELHLITGLSWDVVPQLAQEGIRFDLATIDGDHSGPGAWQDFELVMPHVNEGGAVVFDDIVPFSDGGEALKEIWERAKQTWSNEFVFVENLDAVVPVGIAVRLT